RPVTWGLWAQASAMTGHLSETDRARLARTGVRPLPTAHGLDLLTAALDARQPLSIGVALDPAGLRAQAAGGTLDPRLARLVAPVPGGSETATGAAAVGGGPDGSSVVLLDRLAAAQPSERGRILLGLVKDNVAVVLGRGSGGGIDGARAMKQLGLDSLTAVELRNRLTTATGLKLPATLIFDYPTPNALAAHLDERLAADLEPADTDPLADLFAQLDEAAGAVADDDERVRLADRLQQALTVLRAGAGAADALDGATDDEIFDLIDNDLNVR
ncbi:MAG: beta-ketoacyl reductase, partial [Frankia sp.]